MGGGTETLNIPLYVTPGSITESQGDKEDEEWNYSASQRLSTSGLPQRLRISSCLLQNDDPCNLDILKYPR